MSIENLTRQFGETATRVLAISNDIELIKADIDKLNEKQAAFALNGVSKPSNGQLSQGYLALGEFGRSGGNAGFADFAARLPEVKAAMSVGSDPDGGYTAIPETDTSIHARIRDISPLFDLATVKP